PALIFFFQAEDGIRDRNVTGVQTCALPIWATASSPRTRHRAARAARAWRAARICATTSCSLTARTVSSSRSPHGSWRRTSWGSRSEERRVGKGGGSGRGAKEETKTTRRGGL